MSSIIETRLKLVHTILKWWLIQIMNEVIEIQSAIKKIDKIKSVIPYVYIGIKVSSNLIYKK